MFQICAGKYANYIFFAKLRNIPLKRAFHNAIFNGMCVFMVNKAQLLAVACSLLLYSTHNVIVLYGSLGCLDPCL